MNNIEMTKKKTLISNIFHLPSEIGWPSSFRVVIIGKVYIAKVNKSISIILSMKF